MQEARIIIPKLDHSGRTRSRTIRDLESLIARAFGGYTKTDGQGAWCQTADCPKPMIEPVSIFDVAMDDTPENRSSLRAIAQWLAQAARQERVYTRLPNGTVELIAPLTEEAVA